MIEVIPLVRYAVMWSNKHIKNASYVVSKKKTRIMSCVENNKKYIFTHTNYIWLLLLIKMCNKYAEYLPVGYITMDEGWNFLNKKLSV